jgi:hypothetical protein
MEVIHRREKMMSRLTIALLATFLLSIGAGPAVAQSPSASLGPEPIAIPIIGLVLTLATRLG